MLIYLPFSRLISTINGNERLNIDFVAVPPHQLLVYDASGRDVAGAVGPLQEDDNLVLTCEVRGGK